jgi:hypothetical protein
MQFYYSFNIVVGELYFCCKLKEMKDVKPKKKREPLTETMTLAFAKSQKQRFYRLANELEQRGFDSLHDMTRSAIDDVLDGVEQFLAKSS